MIATAASPIRNEYFPGDDFSYLHKAFFPDAHSVIGTLAVPPSFGGAGPDSWRAHRGARPPSPTTTCGHAIPGSPRPGLPRGELGLESQDHLGQFGSWALLMSCDEINERLFHRAPSLERFF